MDSAFIDGYINVPQFDREGRDFGNNALVVYLDALGGVRGGRLIGLVGRS